MPPRVQRRMRSSSVESEHSSDRRAHLRPGCLGSLAWGSELRHALLVQPEPDGRVLSTARLPRPCDLVPEEQSRSAPCRQGDPQEKPLHLVFALERPSVFLLREARGWAGLGCTQHRSAALPLPGARAAAFLQEHRADLPGTRETSSRSCPVGEAHGRAPEQGTRHCDPVHSSPAWPPCPMQRGFCTRGFISEMQAHRPEHGEGPRPRDSQAP